MVPNTKCCLLTAMLKWKNPPHLLRQLVYNLSCPSYSLAEINLAINTVLPHLSVDYKVLSDEGSSTENSRMAAGGRCLSACISRRGC